MSERVPLWVRAFLRADRLFSRVDSARLALRDELLLAMIPVPERAALCAAMYAPLESYLPGGRHFEKGLFSWEEQALRDPLFPTHGRVLIGACGAGREANALVQRGFLVFAFDPCLPFVHAARRALDPEACEVAHASYDDFVHTVRSASGPLFDRLSRAPFDAVILGWGSFSHVLPKASRLALLRALCALSPSAPVLLSFSLDQPTFPNPPGKGRARDTLRAFFQIIRAPGISEDGDRFFPEGGFFASLREEDVNATALEAGYRVAWLKPYPYPHALLVPLARDA